MLDVLYTIYFIYIILHISIYGTILYYLFYDYIIKREKTHRKSLRFVDINRSGDMVLRSITETYDIEQCNSERCTKIKCADCMWYVEGFEAFMKLLFTALAFDKDSPKDILVMCLKFDSQPDNLHVHSTLIQDPNKFRSLLYSHSPTRFFNIIDPADLHTESTSLDHLI